MTKRENANAVTISVFDDPLTCDPHKAYDSSSRHVVLNVYESLLRYDNEQNSVRPCLSPEVPSPIICPNGQVEYLFSIREGVLFHDGSVMTADDVVYSLRRVLLSSPNISALWVEALLGYRLADPDVTQVLAACERIQPHRSGVLITLAKPFSPFLNLVAHWSLILPRGWAVSQGEWNGELKDLSGNGVASTTSALYDSANGTGPYSLEHWDHFSRTLYFQANSDYWADTPPVSRILLVSEDDRVTRERSLIDGYSDFAVCQPESLRRLRGADNVILEEVPNEWLVTPLGFLSHQLDPDCEAVGSARFDGRGLPPDALSDWHLRRALSLSFDYATFAEEALGNRGVSHCGIFPHTSLADGPVPKYEYDLRQARQHLECAWDGSAIQGGFVLTVYAHRDNYSRVRAAEILAEGFNQLHPNCTIQICKLPLTELVPMLYGGQCPVAWLGWGSDFNHAYDFATQLLAEDSPLPRKLGVKLPRIEQLLTEALEASTKQRADDAFKAIASDAIADQTYLYVPGKVSYLSYHKRWRGVRYKDGVANVLDFSSFKPSAGSKC